MKSDSLANYLFGATRAETLAALFLHPELSLHIRELARLAGASPGSLHRELRALSDLGLLQREAIGRQVHYRANPECPVFDELAGLLRKTVGLADVLHTALEPLGPRVKIAFVHGSVAAGTARPRSDVDVMVIGKVSFAELVRTLAPTQEVLKREVNVTPLTPAALAQKVKAKDGFIKQVLAAPKIFLIGTDHDLAELAAHRAA